MTAVILSPWHWAREGWPLQGSTRAYGPHHVQGHWPTVLHVFAWNQCFFFQEKQKNDTHPKFWCQKIRCWIIFWGHKNPKRYGITWPHKRYTLPGLLRSEMPGSAQWRHLLRGSSGKNQPISIKKWLIKLETHQQIQFAYQQIGKVHPCCLRSAWVPVAMHITNTEICSPVKYPRNAQLQEGPAPAPHCWNSWHKASSFSFKKQFPQWCHVHFFQIYQFSFDFWFHFVELFCFYG